MKIGIFFFSFPMSHWEAGVFTGGVAAESCRGDGVRLGQRHEVLGLSISSASMDMANSGFPAGSVKLLYFDICNSYLMFPPSLIKPSFVCPEGPKVWDNKTGINFMIYVRKIWKINTQDFLKLYVKKNINQGVE